MHDYSIDQHPKEKILFVFTFIAITSVPQLNEAVQELVEYFEAGTG